MVNIFDDNKSMINHTFIIVNHILQWCFLLKNINLPDYKMKCCEFLDRVLHDLISMLLGYKNHPKKLK